MFIPDRRMQQSTNSVGERAGEKKFGFILVSRGRRKIFVGLKREEENLWKLHETVRARYSNSDAFYDTFLILIHRDRYDSTVNPCWNFR